MAQYQLKTGDNFQSDWVKEFTKAIGDVSTVQGDILLSCDGEYLSIEFTEPIDLKSAAYRMETNSAIDCANYTRMRLGLDYTLRDGATIRDSTFVGDVGIVFPSLDALSYWPLIDDDGVISHVYQF